MIKKINELCKEIDQILMNNEFKTDKDIEDVFEVFVILGYNIGYRKYALEIFEEYGIFNSQFDDELKLSLEYQLEILSEVNMRLTDIVRMAIIEKKKFREIKLPEPVTFTCNGVCNVPQN